MSRQREKNVKSYYYSLGPLTWDSDHWRPPANAAGMIDLRGLPACGESGTSVNRQLCLCWFADAADVPDSHTLLNSVAGDIREITVDESVVAKWESRTGKVFSDASQYSSMANVLMDLFTNLSSPVADDVVPTLESETIHLPGHSPVISLPSNWRSLSGFSAHADRLLKRQRGKVSQWILEQSPDVARKALGGLLVKQGERGQGQGKDRTWREDQWQRFVAPQDRATVRRMGGPKPPETTVSDDFSGTLANWGGDTGNFSITGGQCQTTSGSSIYMFYDSALSSDDMTCQLDWVSHSLDVFAGPSVRNSTSAETMYAFTPRAFGFTLYFYKVVTGTWTILNSTGTGPDPEGSVVALDYNGSNWDLIVGGSSQKTGTDSSISGNLNAGVGKGVFSNTWNFDNWSATDGLGGGGGSIIPILMQMGI